MPRGTLLLRSPDATGSMCWSSPALPDPCLTSISESDSAGGLWLRRTDCPACSRGGGDMPIETIGELRASLIKSGATWAPPEDLPDSAKIPQYALGIPEGFPKVEDLKAVDLKKVLTSSPTNPMLAEA